MACQYLLFLKAYLTDFEGFFDVQICGYANVQMTQTQKGLAILQALSV